MKYYSAIIFLFVLSFFNIILLLYFANLTRNIEKKNLALIEKINFIKEQININETEYSFYSSYEYLQKLSKIYLDYNEINNYNNRFSYIDLKNKDSELFQTVGTK